MKNKKPSSDFLELFNILIKKELHEIQKTASRTTEREENKDRKIHQDKIYGLGCDIEYIQDSLDILKKAEKCAIIEYNKINKY